MVLTWKGQFCFQISTNQGKNGPILIVIDPFSKGVSLRVSKLRADIVLVTHNHFDDIKGVVPSDSFVIDGPGEYDIKGVYIQGIPAIHDNTIKKGGGKTTIYTIKAEGIKLCHLGDFSQKELTSEQLEKIEEVDILMIPVGGTDAINGKEAIKIMSQIEPKIIIPMYYKIPKLDIKLESIDSFLRLLSIKKLEPLPKLSIKKKDLSGEEAKIITLEP